MSTHLAAAALADRARWPAVPFRRTAALIVDRNTDAAAPPLSVSSNGAVTERDGDGRQASSDATIRNGWVTRPGDLIVNPMWLIGGGIAVTNIAGSVSPDYRVYRFTPGVHPPYMHHLLRSAEYRSQYRLYTRAESTFDRRVAKEDFHQMPVPLPPEEEQRRISDFLDDQVARFDRAIELRRSQLQLAEDRLETRRDSIIDASGAPQVALGHLASFLTDGDWIESPFITESGVRLLQTGNVGRGEYREQGFRYISEKTFRELGCTSVRPGDVLISRLSPPVGRACLAPALDGPMIASVDVAILRSDTANHRYLIHALSTRRYLESVAVASRGATMARISRSQLSRFTVPLPELPVQTAVAARLDKAASETTRAGSLLNSSLDLLQERKQALITAAVTGQLDVTTARAVA